MKTKNYLLFYIFLLLVFNLTATNYTSNTTYGQWGSSSSWLPLGVPGPGDNVTILNGHTIKESSQRVANNVTINTGGTLNVFILTVNQLLTNNGTMITPTALFFGTGIVITGSGTFTVAAGNWYFYDNQTIDAGVTINAAGYLQLYNSVSYPNISLTNNGNVTFSSGVKTQTTTVPCTFTNGTNAYFKIGSTFPTIVTINASAVGNTMSFGGTTYTLNTPSSSTYYNLDIYGGGTKTFPNNLSILGNFSIQTTINIAGINLSVGGNWINNNATLSATASTVITFNGSSSQLISRTSGSEYLGNIIFSGTGVKTLGTNITTGQWTINPGATVDVSPSNYSISVSGNWVNNGGTFIPRASTVTLSGNAQSISSTSGETFYDLVLAGTSTKTLAGNITAGGALTISNSVTLDVSSSNYSVTVGGNWTSSGTFIGWAGTVTFNGTGTQNITGTASPAFYNLVKSGSGTANLLRNSTVSHLFTISNGIFNLGTTTLTGAAALTMSNGELQLAQLNITLPALTGTYTLTGGMVTFNGAGAQLVRGTTYYNLDILGSGIKSAAAALDINGTLSISSTLDVTNNNYPINCAGNWINNGTYTARLGTVIFDGVTAMSGTSINSFKNVTITGALTAPSLSINIAGNWINNGSYTHNNGTVTFNGTTAITGSATTNFNNVSITGALVGHSTAMNVAGNWANNGTFTHNNGTVIFNGSTLATGSSITSFRNVTITGILTAHATAMNISGGFVNNGTFNANSGLITFNGTTTVSGSSTTTFNNITISGTLTGHSTVMNVAGNWINNGIFTHNSGLITFNGTTTVSGSSTTNFKNVTISGTLTGHSATMNIAGNWINNGTFTHNNGLITFNGVTSVSGSSVTSFNKITIIGTLTGHSSNMNIAGNWINNGTYVHNSGTVTFNGTSSISGSSTTDFNNVTISGTLTSHPTTIDVAGNWIDNGTFLHNNATVNFNGTTTISGSSSHSFNNIIISGTLTGPNDMNVSGNWSNDGTYNSNLGTIVFNGTTTVSGNSTTSFNNITISSTLIGHNNAMEVTGNMVTNGSYTSNNGLITFNGPSLQSLSGSGIADFELMTLNNANGMNINSGNYYLHDVITLTAGTISNIGGTFTLAADATKYSRIAPIDALCTTCGFSGNFDVQRYIPSRNIGTWADLSSPVSNATMAEWDNSLFLVYPFIGFDDINNRPTGSNVMAYDEPSAAYYELNSSTPLSAGMGFEIGLTNDSTDTSFSTTTLNTIGTPNFGAFDIPLTYTATNGPAYPVGYSGENLVGNPFASAINLGAMTITNALSTVDVYDYTIDNYTTLSGSDIIGPHQGFWAYAQSTGASIYIPETAKTTNSSTDIHRSITQDAHPYLNLTLSSADGSNAMAHTLMVACNENASDGWDNSDHPFRKSLNPKAPSITANAGEAIVSINTFNNNHETYIMPLNLKIGIDGKYQLSASGIKNVSDYPVVLLEDKFTHTFINLNNSNDYTFSARTTDSKQRFALHFSKSANYTPANTAIVNDLANDVQILQNSNGNTINFNLSKTENIVISVMDLLGKNIMESTNVEANNQSINITLPDNFHGLYFVTVQSASGKTIKKFVTEK